MADCTVITAGFTHDCDTIPPTGAEAILYLWNHKHVESYTESAGVISAITLSGSNVAYKFTGFDMSFGASEDVQRSATTGKAQLKHKCKLVIASRAAAQKANVNKIINSRMVGALVLKGTDVDARLLIGRDVGLQVAAGEIYNTNANDGFFILNLATPDGDLENENKVMASIYVTSLTATDAMLEGLLT